LRKINFLKFENETWDAAISSYWFNIICQIDESTGINRGLASLPRRVKRFSHLLGWVGAECGILFSDAWDVLGNTKKANEQDLLKNADEWKAFDTHVRNEKWAISEDLMLQEYRELGSLTIPWGALFEIEVCNFSYFRVYEMWDRLVVAWFSKDGKNHVQTMIGNQLLSELARSFETKIQNLDPTDKVESERLRHP
jgi:hypothetical protein